MEDKKNKLDDLYQRKFENFELPVSDALLEKIKQETESSKKRIVYWKWMLMTAIILIGATGMYYIYTSKTSSVAAVHPASNGATTTTDKSVIENKNVSTTNGVANNSTAEQQPNKTIETADAINNSTEKLTTTGTSATAATTDLNKNTTAAKANTTTTEKNKSTTTTSNVLSTENSTAVKRTDNQNKTENTPNKNTIATTNTDKNTSAKTNNQPNTNKTKDVASTDKNTGKSNSSTATANKEKTKSDENNLSANTNTINKTSETKKEDNPKINTNNNEPLNSSASIENNKQKRVTDSIIPKKDSIKTIAKAVKKDSTKAKPTPPVVDTKPDTKAKKLGFFVELNGGPSLSYRTLSANTDSILSNRNDLEKKQYTYSVGIDFGMSINNKFRFSIGVGIDNKSESYSFAGLPAKYNSRDSTFNDSGQVVTITIKDTIKAKPSFDTKNTYQFLKIPIMIGYQFTIKDKWFIRPSVGVNINYLLSAHSSWFDLTTNQTVNYYKKDNVFASVSASLRLKLALGINITDKFSISIEPGYTRFLQSIYKSDFSSKLLPYSYDLNIGVGYKF